MIGWNRAPLTEPAGFDERCRRPGNAWLAANPTSRRPRDYWSPFKPALADGQRNLCAYSAMWEPVGTVDHFDPGHDLAYEWSNYRFAAQWINSSKKRESVLDPFLVENGWFRLLLPSLQ